MEDNLSQRKQGCLIDQTTVTDNLTAIFQMHGTDRPSLYISSDDRPISGPICRPYVRGMCAQVCRVKRTQSAPKECASFCLKLRSKARPGYK